MTKKSKSNLNIFFMFMALIFVAITGVFYISIVKLGVLPGKYVLIFSLIMLILTVLIILGLTKNGRKKKLNIICLIIAIIFSVIYVFAIKYAKATSDFLGGMFKEVVETEEYYVIIKSNSKYSDISSLKDKDIAVFQAEDDVMQEVTENAKTILTSVDSLSELGTNLIDGDVDAILVSSSQYDMLDEEIENFKSNTKILYTVEHVFKKTVINSESDYNVANRSFNIYISGIDTSGNISNVARSDSNMIATVNLDTHEILLTSIPRDYYVTLHSKKAKDKLTHSGIYGINETVTTVEDLLDIDINYYIRVNFTTVTKLVDELDGIDVNSDYSFSTTEYSFKKGTNHLYGKAALAFSRERSSFIDGDNQRVKNQQKVIEAIVNKITGSTTILRKYTNILGALEGCFQTNIGEDEIKNIVKDQLDTMSSWKISSNSLTGSDAHKSTYSMGSQELYVMIPDETSVKEATEKINDILEK